MVQLKKYFELYDIFQFRFGNVGGYPFDKMNFFMLGSANHNIRITDVNC